MRNWWLFLREVSGALLGKSSLITVFLCLVLIASAVGVIFASHLNRQLFTELALLQEARDAYEMEWSQLLLEQSAWSAHGRVEYLATTKLDMKVPEAKDIVVMK
ncbi:cell division protein FtsL [Alkalimarinus coralli]|uniref:cell division protein FtsL n=1 Tax=Alkalimarinus coralli TaxID=2935863 RepID=UPI00202B0F51|nr:cell division protein FtsL [Alkalimarinus coralli]